VASLRTLALHLKSGRWKGPMVPMVDRRSPRVAGRRRVIEVCICHALAGLGLWFRGVPSASHWAMMLRRVGAESRGGKIKGAMSLLQIVVEQCRVTLDVPHLSGRTRSL
jgi:hypothetical protein